MTAASEKFYLVNICLYFISLRRIRKSRYWFIAFFFIPRTIATDNDNVDDDHNKRHLGSDIDEDEEPRCVQLTNQHKGAIRFIRKVNCHHLYRPHFLHHVTFNKYQIDIFKEEKWFFLNRWISNFISFSSFTFPFSLLFRLLLLLLFIPHPEEKLFVWMFYDLSFYDPQKISLSPEKEKFHHWARFSWWNHCIKFRNLTKTQSY